MSLNWSLVGNAPDPGNAFMKGFQNGQGMAKQMRTQQALGALSRNPNDAEAVNALMAFNPELGMKFQDRQLAEQKRNALSRLFEPAATDNGASPNAVVPNQNALAAFAQRQPAPAGGAMSAPPPPVAMNPDGTPPAALPEQGGPAAPRQLVDPERLPPRTDGLKLNQGALRDLYRLDPQTAIAVQKNVFDANASQFKQMQAMGGQLASAAWHLMQLPEESRAGEMEAMAPLLIQMGIDPNMLAQADLSDQGLRRYLSIGRSINNIVDDDRADRRLDADMADDEADNERADRNTDSLISDRTERRGLTRRNQDLTDARGRRGQNIASTDRRRNQDMTDRRTRERAGFRGGGKGRGGGQQVVAVRSIDEARALPAGTVFRTPDGRVKVR